jgi:aryl-alcohol dehydrogenase-like predicted oxidoreductase
MEYRRLGQTELNASTIGFGCSRIAQASTTNERRAVVCALQTALDRGINFFDTADSYDHGASELLLGTVFRRQRDRVILCSKAGYRSWLLLALDR